MLYTPDPLNIIDVPADNNHMSDGRLAYDFIFLHDTEGFDSANYLSTTSIPPNLVSVHRLIARGPTKSHPEFYDGAIIKIVPDEKVAFTQGHGVMGGYPDNERPTNNLNRVSLSIEFERHSATQKHTTKQLISGAKQVVEWYAMYDMPSLLYHWHVDPNKDDPRFFPRALFMQFVLTELARYIKPIYL